MTRPPMRGLLAGLEFVACLADAGKVVQVPGAAFGDRVDVVHDPTGAATDVAALAVSMSGSSNQGCGICRPRQIRGLVVDQGT